MKKEKIVTWAEYPVSPTEFDLSGLIRSKPKGEEVTIKRSDNGVIVTAGCKTLVFQNTKKKTGLELAFEAIELYFEDSNAAQEKYLK